MKAEIKSAASRVSADFLRRAERAEALADGEPGPLSFAAGLCRTQARIVERGDNDPRMLLAGFDEILRYAASAGPERLAREAGVRRSWRRSRST